MMPSLPRTFQSCTSTSCSTIVGNQKEIISVNLYLKIKYIKSLKKINFRHSILRGYTGTQEVTSKNGYFWESLGFCIYVPSWNIQVFFFTRRVNIEPPGLVSGATRYCVGEHGPTSHHIKCTGTIKLVTLRDRLAVLVLSQQKYTHASGTYAQFQPRAKRHLVSSAVYLIYQTIWMDITSASIFTLGVTRESDKSQFAAEAQLRHCRCSGVM